MPHAPRQRPTRHRSAHRCGRGWRKSPDCSPTDSRIIREEAIDTGPQIGQDFGDAVAANLILEAARWLGIGIVTFMHTIDPEAVIIGGAMTFGGEEAPVGRAFIERVRAEVRDRAFPVLVRETVIRYASLGGDAGSIGAAGLARLADRKGG